MNYDNEWRFLWYEIIEDDIKQYIQFKNDILFLSKPIIEIFNF